MLRYSGYSLYPSILLFLLKMLRKRLFLFPVVKMTNRCNIVCSYLKIPVASMSAIPSKQHTESAVFALLMLKKG